MTEKKWIVGSLLLVALSLAGVALAAPATHSIERWVMGGGGGSDAAGSLALSGTLGQAVTGVDSSSGAILCAGFWCQSAAERQIFVPIVIKNHLP